MPRKRVTSVRVEPVTARAREHGAQRQFKGGFDGCLRALCAHVGVLSAQDLSRCSGVPARRTKSWWLGQRLPDRSGMGAIREALRNALNAQPSTDDRRYYDLVRRLEVEWTLRAHRGLGHPKAVRELPRQAMRWETFARYWRAGEAPDAFIMLDDATRDRDSDVYLPRIFVRSTKLAQQPHCIVTLGTDLYVGIQYQFTTTNRTLTLFRDGEPVREVSLSDVAVLYVESDIRTGRKAHAE